MGVRHFRVSLTVVLTAIGCGLGTGFVAAEPIAIKTGHFSLPWDDPAHFHFVAPSGFELRGLFPIGTLSPQQSCIGGCRPAAIVNLSSIAGGDMPAERFPLGRATSVTMNGTRLFEPFGLRSDSPRLAGTLRFDAASVALPPIAADAFFVELRAPFVLTGDVKGFAHDDLDGQRPLFDVALSGHGMATVRFDVLGDRYGDPEVVYEMSPVPEPATMTLLGIGVAGLAGRAWRRTRRKG